MKQFVKTALIQEDAIYFLKKVVFSNISEKLETSQIYNKRETHTLQ